FARLRRDDARARVIVAMLCGVADGIAHVTESAAINQVNDKLHFVQALEVSHLRLITGIHKSFKARLDQFADTAAKDGLLAEKVRLGFFGKSSFEHSGARRAKSPRVGERQRFGLPGGVL